MEALLEAEQGVSDSQLQRLLGHFHAAGVVTQDQDGNWLLTRDLDSFSLMDLYHAGHFHLPLGGLPELPTRSKWDAGLLEALEHSGLRMDRSLKSLLKEGHDAD